MLSAHPNGICPYCFMVEEPIHFSFLTLFSLNVAFEDGQITPNYVTHPSLGEALRSCESA